MRKFMNSNRVSFKDLKVSVYLAESKSKLINKIKVASVKAKIGLNPKSIIPLLNAVKESKETTLYFYSSEDALDKLPKTIFKEFVILGVFKVIQKALFQYLYFFPIERTTLIGLPMGIFKQSKRLPYHGK